MKLKKINENLAQTLEEAGLTIPTAVQKSTFGTMKSGVDCVIAAPDGMGKTTTIVINIIQRLEKAFQQSPRALVIVQDKAKVLEMEALFDTYAKHTDLRVYGVYEQGDLDYDKNQISVGVDVLIGTPGRLNDMFSSAGFDVNQLKMFILDDANVILKARHDTKVMRMSDGIAKTQRIFFTDEITERTESLADRIMIEPLFFEFDEEDEQEEQD